MHTRVHVYTYVITYTHNYSCTFTHTHQCFSLSPMSHSTIRTSCTVTHYGTPVGKCLALQTHMPWSSSLYDRNFHRSSHRSSFSIGTLDSNISFGQQIFLDTNISVLSAHELWYHPLGFKKCWVYMCSSLYFVSYRDSIAVIYFQLMSLRNFIAALMFMIFLKCPCLSLFLFLFLISIIFLYFFYLFFCHFSPPFSSGILLLVFFTLRFCLYPLG